MNFSIIKMVFSDVKRLDNFDKLAMNEAINLAIKMWLINLFCQTTLAMVQRKYRPTMTD